MPRLNKQQKERFAMLEKRLAEAERKAGLWDSLLWMLRDALRDDLEEIARQAAEEIADDLTISH